MTKISKILIRIIFSAILSIFEEQKIEPPEISIICRILWSFGFLRGIEQIEVFRERILTCDEWLKRTSQ